MSELKLDIEKERTEKFNATIIVSYNHYDITITSTFNGLINASTIKGSFNIMKDERIIHEHIKKYASSYFYVCIALEDIEYLKEKAIAVKEAMRGKYPLEFLELTSTIRNSEIQINNLKIIRDIGFKQINEHVENNNRLKKDTKKLNLLINKAQTTLEMFLEV